MDANQRLFPANRKTIEEGPLIEMIQDKNTFVYGSNTMNESRRAKHQIQLHENCIKVLVDTEGEKEYFYVYHEDVFHPSNYKYSNELITNIQCKVLNVWKNPNYNGYITSNGVKRRHKLTQTSAISKI
eukprot:671_1